MGEMADWARENGELAALEEGEIEDEEETAEFVEALKERFEEKALVLRRGEPQTSLVNTVDGKYSLRSLIQIGTMLARSGYFADAAQEAQAVAKVLAGAELGIAPIAAMTGIFIVKGRVTIGANILAALIKRSKKYKFRILKLSATECEIRFFEDDEEVGVSTFTLTDANTAGLVKDGSGWKKYPRNMLFARALTNGSRWYCPDLTVFPVYTPDELDEDAALPEAADTRMRVVDQEAFAKLQEAEAETF